MSRACAFYHNPCFCKRGYGSSNTNQPTRANWLYSPVAVNTLRRCGSTKTNRQFVSQARGKMSTHLCNLGKEERDEERDNESERKREGRADVLGLEPFRVVWSVEVRSLTCPFVVGTPLILNVNCRRTTRRERGSVAFVVSRSRPLCLDPPNFRLFTNPRKFLRKFFGLFGPRACRRSRKGLHHAAGILPTLF